jgi:hypothetical protein
MDLTPCAVVLARSRTSSAPFSVGLIETKDVQVSIIVPDLDVAVVRSVPLIKRFENVDLMLVEMKFQGHGHSAMISILFDMNTHFWFQSHSKRHAISTVRPGTGDQLEPNSIRSEHTHDAGARLENNAQHAAMS